MRLTKISPARPLDASAWRVVANGHIDEDGAGMGSARAEAREVRGEAGEGGKASRVRLGHRVAFLIILSQALCSARRWQSGRGGRGWPPRHGHCRDLLYAARCGKESPFRTGRRTLAVPNCSGEKKTIEKGTHGHRYSNTRPQSRLLIELATATDKSWC